VPHSVGVQLTTCVALAVFALMSQASAQQPPEPGKPPAANPIEAVVVTGYRSSLESALNKKREDNGIVDVIKAEDIAKFPDTNLAEALQRVPGVAIDRDAGEGHRHRRGRPVWRPPQRDGLAACRWSTGSRASRVGAFQRRGRRSSVIARTCARRRCRGWSRKPTAR
jgi:hypothetical protein